jgi:hypothetical protein
MYHQISDKSLKGFKEACEKDGIKYETEQEYRDSAQNLLNFLSTLIEIDQKERTRKKRLETEPKGFALEGEGRNCSLCHHIVFEGNGWYDKWGFKCMNCQSAVDKKKIPGSLCGDWKHDKCITDSSLSDKFDLHTQTIRKLIRQGKIIARQIPNGPNIIMRKDNPKLIEVLETEKVCRHK